MGDTQCYRKAVMYTDYLDDFEDKNQTKEQFELSCPNDDQTFIVDSEEFFRNPTWQCYCGMRYEIAEVANG